MAWIERWISHCWSLPCSLPWLTHFHWSYLHPLFSENLTVYPKVYSLQPPVVEYSCCTHISSLESRIPGRCAQRCKQLQHLDGRWPCKKVLSAHWKILKLNKHSLGSFVPIIYLLLRTLTLFLLAVLPWHLYSTSCLLTSKNRFNVLAKLRVFSHPLSKDYIGCEDDEQNVFFPNILLW